MAHFSECEAKNQLKKNYLASKSFFHTTVFHSEISCKKRAKN
jgi:hypothetical protein